jgi:tetratricopeptide (TPR) repeat protein
MYKQKSFRYAGPTPSRHLLNGIEQIQSKMQEGDYETAGEILQGLEDKYRKNTLLLTVAYNYYSETQDYFALEPVCRSLYEMDKRDPDIALSTATTYMMNNRTGMARKIFVDFLGRWPDHEDASFVRKSVENIESTLREEVEPNLTDAQVFEELIVLHDEVRYALDHQLYPQGKRLAEQLLAQYPAFAPGLNNLAQIHYLEGNFSKAIQVCRRAVEMSPANIHALANYARMLYVAGRDIDLEEVAARLKKSEGPATDKWTKIAEALGFIGDDEGVLDLYARVKAEKQLGAEYVSPLFYHLVAVAYANRGNEQKAKAFWNQALKLDPEFEFAVENLEDIHLPKHERNGAWAYTVQYWFPALKQELKNTLGSSGRHAKTAVNKFIHDHPEVLRLAPVLFQRGDPSSRQFLIGIAGITENKDLGAAAKEFALGQKGSDKLRLEAAQMLSQNKQLPSGPTRMWIKGEWCDLLMLGFEINGEPRIDLPKAAMAIYSQSHRALKNEDGARAQQILEEGVKKFPDSPSLWNNLAVAYQMQGDLDKSRKMLDEVSARFPDYFFAIVAKARMEMSNQNYAAAHELLSRAMQRESFHFSEFDFLSAIQIDLLLLEGQPDGAEQWLGIWEEMMPDSPALKEYKEKVSLGLLAASGRSLRSKRRKVNER